MAAVQLLYDHTHGHHTTGKKMQKIGELASWRNNRLCGSAAVISQSTYVNNTLVNLGDFLGALLAGAAGSPEVGHRRLCCLLSCTHH
jgi:hypothetical protein